MSVNRLRSFPIVAMAIIINSSVAGAKEERVSTHLSYIGESVSNVRGGKAVESTYLGTADLSVLLETQGDSAWFAEVIVNHGQNPSDFIGDVQGASNIADGERVRLQQFWYRHVWDNHNSLTVGLHDLNSEFYVSGHASLFLNSSFGIGPEISGNVPTSLWPEAGLGIRFENKSDHHYYHIEVYDGQPATRVIDTNKEGLMWIAETAHLVKNSTYKFGTWLHTADKVAPDGQVYSNDYGVYMVLDYVVDDTWGLFVQAGETPEDRNDINSYFGVGIHFHGPIPNRQSDTLGIALARAGFSAINRNTNNLTEAETTVEITYDMRVTDYLSIHPAYQWIQHPSGDKTLAAANVAMLRFEMSI